MKKEVYEKVFQHITDLAQKNALGKIAHQTMYDGLKKLLEELIAEEASHTLKVERRKAFWKGWFTGVGLLAALAYAANFLWQKGYFSAWLKGVRF